MNIGYLSRHTRYITCPYCGYVDKNSWEVSFEGGLEGDEVLECNSCSETFIATRHVDVTYSSATTNVKQLIPVPNTISWGEEDGFTKEEK
mgnify:CR=1 FL=1